MGMTPRDCRPESHDWIDLDTMPINVRRETPPRRALGEMQSQAARDMC